MKKTRLLIASVLKPVNDTRMFEKIGCSLAKLPNTEVHLAGFPGVLPNTKFTISFHPFSAFKRLSWGRVKVQWEFWQLLRQLQPDLLIISTHEFLIVAVLFKLFFKKKLWYDVRENYYLNLTTQNFYGGVTKHLLAYGIRVTEILSAPFIAHYLLAEKSYAGELPFIKNKFTVLENKYISLIASPPVYKTFPVKIESRPIRFLFSGTISQMHGIFEAIALCQQLQERQAAISLTIIGYCAVPDTFNRLKELQKACSFITLIGGDSLVPHSEIVKQIQNCHVGLLPYQPHPSTFRCVPTKLFEYLANGLPVLVQENPYWADIINQNKAGVNLNFKKFNASAILKKLTTQEFYPDGSSPEVFWSTEEVKLLSLFNKYFKHP
ncbi:glycosyltransferase [Adhaeribacter pallidiroseus]|uniref:Glycosyl transferase family 1 domain-containing protein n=1 Tax=Adhaeribacter pallidiroseus TaxID=2072847 RepID=A0A369QK18_9BACT|nr:glycosyltransferase [Adhaeribacter pallidiroseus]RDC63587.1 hypothetical protein AHMF7616_02192 [Adhaeribacter pallidiroseus]